MENTSSETKMVKCEFCGKTVKESDFTSHILVKHPSEQ